MQGWRLTSILVGFFACTISHTARAQAAGDVPRSVELYEVQCGVLSAEALRDRPKPRFAAAKCKLTLSGFENGLTKFDFVGALFGRTITWSFVGDTETNVYKQLEPQAGGKFNRSVRTDLACFVPFETEGLDDSESWVCYKRATLRSGHGWDGETGKKFPVP